MRKSSRLADLRRKRQVVAFAQAGLGIQDIARVMHLRPRTIRRILNAAGIRAVAGAEADEQRKEGTS